MKKRAVLQESQAIHNDQRLAAHPRQNPLTKPPLALGVVDLQPDSLARLAAWPFAKLLDFDVDNQAEARVGEALTLEKASCRRLAGANSATDPNHDRA